jgi:hypothetical protein
MGVLRDGEPFQFEYISREATHELKEMLPENRTHLIV